MQLRCGTLADMDELAELRRTIEDRDRSIQAVHEAIASAIRSGVSVQAVAEAAGYHRNHIARIARAQGVPDARLKSPD